MHEVYGQLASYFPPHLPSFDMLPLVPPHAPCLHKQTPFSVHLAPSTVLCLCHAGLRQKLCYGLIYINSARFLKNSMKCFLFKGVECANLYIRLHTPMSNLYLNLKSAALSWHEKMQEYIHFTRFPLQAGSANLLVLKQT